MALQKRQHKIWHSYGKPPLGGSVDPADRDEIINIYVAGVMATVFFFKTTSSGILLETVIR